MFEFMEGIGDVHFTSSTSTLTCIILYHSSRSNSYSIQYYQYCALQNTILAIHNSFIIVETTKTSFKHIMTHDFTMVHPPRLHPQTSSSYLLFFIKIWHCVHYIICLIMVVRLTSVAPRSTACNLTLNYTSLFSKTDTNQASQLLAKNYHCS
jgi:hypothetical protein